MFDHGNVVSNGARVSAGVLAAMLAEDGWSPKVKPFKTEKVGFAASSVAAQAKKKVRIARKVIDRETAEALPAGHSVTWAALWGADKVPVFPGLVAMGARDVVGSFH
ncbi:hypothetical protein AA106555_1903 [Neokomagataea thailandica NBRC 106555]|uniref:Transcriptional regulator n=3 Tax=Neokomagataea TaxID=1223423 RepID=A0A4Y6V750_9PROT|nr:transcriptional regulator [Neokomagataea thailandica]QDH24461.1 transcriptional regulator [Neokomagataea tanensis]GBR55010.1 hypothetical protein AA106555_1903 [Neokomagataea thailandica NBRC 106555]